ncbi:MAG: group II intron reverse transcriptase/maturase [Thermoplasmata archaeon]
MRTAKQIHAFSHRKLNWDSINWETVGRKVKKLQMRIAKAVREGRYRLAKSLQWILTHSFYAKLLAVKRVVTNKGKATPGVDGVIWNTPEKKMQAVDYLKRRGYHPLPLRRVYIKKRSGKLRPLGIPTMRDRAMQALYALALAPVAETTGDLNSYGFREYRSCADAIEQCFICLAKQCSPRWILEADIKACFDSIDQEWILNNILTDKKVLRSWLEAGYMDKGRLYPTKAGTPQGSIVSPLLANMTLDGLEAAVKTAVSKSSKVNVIRYADDFVVTGESKEILQEKVRPVIQSFLKERGLNLSGEKTKITRIEDGFDFLGQQVRKYGEKFIITPSKSSVKSVIAKIKQIAKSYLGQSTSQMIEELNPVIRGWANYHRHVCSKETFGHIDSCIFTILWNWVRRRHRNKGKRWIKKRYFRTIGLRKWVFFGTQKREKGESRIVDLLYMSTIKIVRHVKVRGKANPYSRDGQGYLAERRYRKYAKPSNYIPFEVTEQLGHLNAEVGLRRA